MSGPRHTLKRELQTAAAASRHALNRRDFLKTTTVAVTAAVGGVGAETVVAGQPEPSRGSAEPGLVDANVWLSHWPFRRLPLDEAPALVSKLRSQGVTQAWAGTFDGLLHKDIGSANARLAEACRRHGRGLLVPFGAINPMLPDWPEEVRRCHEEHRMPGLRLSPNYHGYELDHAAFARLLDVSAERGLLVQLAAAMEDERTQHPLMRVPQVNVAPLLSLLKERPAVRVVLLNWNRAVSGGLLPKLAGTGQVCFDIACLEGVGGVANLCRQVPAERVLFGSYAPFYYFEAAALKLKESPLTREQEECVRQANARRLLQVSSRI